MIFKQNDAVTLTVDGRAYHGFVVIASPCGGSLVVWCEDQLVYLPSGMLAETVPLLRQSDGTFIEILQQTPVTLDARTQA